MSNQIQNNNDNVFHGYVANECKKENAEKMNNFSMLDMAARYSAAADDAVAKFMKEFVAKTNTNPNSETTAATLHETNPIPN